MGEDDDVDAPVFGAASGSGVGGDGVVLGVSGGGEGRGIDFELSDEETGHVGGAGGGQLAVGVVLGGVDGDVVGGAFDAQGVGGGAEFLDDLDAAAEVSVEVAE